MRVHCLIIDMQNDFCTPQGTLFVAGADKDAVRLSKMMARVKDRIDDYHVTLDTHHFYDVAHPAFWVDSKGNHPNPFTLISHEDVKNGVWKPTNPSENQRMLTYTETLKNNNRYLLCIWPVHCLIGSSGHNVVDPVAEQLLEWEKQIAMVDYVTKGSNYLTEHYSAVCADCPDATDASTQLNTKLIETLQSADVVALAGEAKSHCCRFTITDICNEFGEENIKKMYLLEDAMSSVTGFEKQGEDFVNEMVVRGMNITTTDKFLK